jgi:uncharacterized membrane protein YphA (DoxX/SURF4 family)
VWTHSDRPVVAAEPAQVGQAEEPEPTPPSGPDVAPTLPSPPPLTDFAAPAASLAPEATAPEATPAPAESAPTQTFAAAPIAAASTPDAGTPAAEAGAAPATDEAIFRPYPAAGAEQPPAVSPEQTEEERKLAAERAARREARAAALTTAGTPEPVEGAAAAPIVQEVVRIKRTTDGFWGSLGLFLLRLVMAAVFGVWGVQMLLDPAKTQQLFARTVLPYPILATIVPVASLLIAVSMVIGLATRYAAVGAALISIGALVLVYWGSWSLLLPNDFGFYGERELLVAAAALLLIFVGAGGWSLDGSLRRARAADKAARVA